MRKLKAAEYILRDTSGFIEGVFKTIKEARTYAKCFPEDGILRSIMRSPVEWYIDGKLVTETTVPKIDPVSGMRYWGKNNIPCTKEEFISYCEKQAEDYVNMREEWEDCNKRT